jgi:hypothetical protein
MQEGDGQGFLSPGSKEEVIRLEKRRWVLLEEKEATWRLKSRDLWLSCGDENTKYFQACAKGRKLPNTIWELNSGRGEYVMYFEGLSGMGVEHFQVLFKVQGGTSIADIVWIALFFPWFVGGV